MHLFLRVISSPWFWADVALSLSGGVFVYVGLLLERKAQKLVPPADFHHDIFEDVVKLQKSKSERGWRILMTGIVMEVVAALGISVISRLEIADLNDKAEIASKLAAESNERSRQLEATNLVLRSNVVALEIKLQPRIITHEQREKFIKFLEGTPKGPVKMGLRHPDNESQDYAEQIVSLLRESGFTIASKMNYQENTTKFPTNSSLGLFVESPSTQPVYFTGLFEAFEHIGIIPQSFTSGAMTVSQGRVGSNEVMVFVIEKQRFVHAVFFILGNIGAAFSL